MLLLSILVLLCSCGNNLVGRWKITRVETNYGDIYGSSLPNLYLDLNGDHTFTYGDSAGEWSARGDSLTLNCTNGKKLFLKLEGSQLTQSFDSSKYYFLKE